MALNLSIAPTKRDGPWKPGQSGNPAGRAKRVERSAAEQARNFTEEAIKALVVALHHPPSRVPAAVALLDRGWGKPLQTVHTQSESTVLHLLAAQAIGTELLSLQTQPPVIEQTVEQRADDTPTE